MRIVGDGPGGELFSIDGKGDIERIDDEDPPKPGFEYLMAEEIELDQHLDFGNELRSGRGAFVSIDLGRSGTLDIGPRSKAVVRRGADPGEISVKLEFGRLIAALGERFLGYLRIATPSVTLGAPGTLIEVQVLHDGTTRIWVYEGQVLIEDLDLRIWAGSQILIRPDGSPLPPSPISLRETTTLLQTPELPDVEDPPLLEQVDPRVFVKDF